MRSSLLTAFALLVAACGSESPSAPQGPRFYEDVAPILRDHCLQCHNDQGIAPFSLERYEDAVDVAGLMKVAVEERTMPPWGVDNTGACGTWQDARWLEQEEIDVIAAWAGGDKREGDEAAAPGPAAPPPHLENPTHTVEMATEYTPDETLDDDYRCFIVDPGLTTDQFLTAYEVHPGQPSEVHHVVLLSLPTAEDEALVEGLDEADPGPGYTCFGGSGAAASTALSVWAPGTPATHYPEGTGLRILGGRKLVIQVHYNLSAGAAPDRTAIDLELHDSVIKEAVISGMADLDFSLPPGQPTVEGSEEIPLTTMPISVYVHAVYPHMHKAGQTLRLEIERDGESICMVDVPRWDFSWQQYYTYDRPFLLGPQDKLKIRCTWDTRDRDQTTTFGEGTMDEMCIAAMYVTW